MSATPVIVTGIPVENVDTSNMSPRSRPPVVRGTRIALQRMGTGLTERSQNRSGQLFQMGMNFVMGILLPVYALVVYYSTSGDDPRGAPCDKPIAGWLYTYAVIGLVTGLVRAPHPARARHAPPGLSACAARPLTRHRAAPPRLAARAVHQYSNALRRAHHRGGC